jgi:hypothetical protein
MESLRDLVDGEVAQPAGRFQALQPEELRLAAAL